MHWKFFEKRKALKYLSSSKNFGKIFCTKGDRW